jgi:hypothetical protein
MSDEEIAALREAHSYRPLEVNETLSLFTALEAGPWGGDAAGGTGRGARMAPQGAREG